MMTFLLTVKSLYLPHNFTSRDPLNFYLCDKSSKSWSNHYSTTPEFVQDTGHAMDNSRFTLATLKQDLIDNNLHLKAVIQVYSSYFSPDRL